MSAAVESLYTSSVDVKPVTADWSVAFRWNDDADESDGAYWETCERELGDATHTLLVESGLVVGVVVDGRTYRDHDDYVADWEEDHPDVEPPIHSSDWELLTGSDPAVWGSEGPMMNYWYPVDRIRDDDDAATAAVTIGDLPLCVVRVGNDYGMALTGGGMDMSWEICAAYVALGCLPPAHFADLPRFAGGHGERPEVVAAMLRSLSLTSEWARRAAAQLVDRFGVTS